MKIDLKVPCSIDMSVINKQMAVVDQKKMELKKAIDDLANTSVELVFGNKEKQAPVEKKPTLAAGQTKKDFFQALYAMESETAETIFGGLNEQEVKVGMEELWNVAFPFFNERLGQPETKMPSYLDFETALNEANATILEDYLPSDESHSILNEVWNIVLALFSGRSYLEVSCLGIPKTDNVPDYPEWRDLLEQNNAHILELVARYPNLDIEQAMKEVYHLSKDFFNK